MTGPTAAPGEADIAIRGNPSADDVAAVLALVRELAGRRLAATPGGYERWRSGRLAALRRQPPA